MDLPARTVFDLYSETPKVWQWQPPAGDELDGVRRLVQVVVSFREKLREIRAESGAEVERLGLISDKAVAEFFRFAFKASFFTDEGRPLKLSLHVPPGSWEPAVNGANTLLFPRIEEMANRERRAIRFENPVTLDDAKLLSRLGPAIQGTGAVLLVEEQQRGLFATEVAWPNDDRWKDNVLNMPRLDSHPQGLFAEILGPGHLRVAEGRGEYTLFANEVLVHRSAIMEKPVCKWLCDVSRMLLKKTSKEPLEELFVQKSTLPDEIPQVDVFIFWANVLVEAIRQKHGGAIVVLPELPNPLVKPKFELKPVSLAKFIGNAWTTGSRLFRHCTSGSTLEDARHCLTRHQFELDRMRSMAEFVGSLTATDGCVLIDRNLTLHGFGGSILSAEMDNGVSDCIDLASCEVVEKDDLFRRFGERHRSAYRLCQTIPGALAFVVSQDGDLRLFASDDQHVYFGNHLHPR